MIDIVLLPGLQCDLLARFMLLANAILYRFIHINCAGSCQIASDPSRIECIHHQVGPLILKTQCIR